MCLTLLSVQIRGTAAAGARRGKERMEDVGDVERDVLSLGRFS
jgi:hypothetical protein